MDHSVLIKTVAAGIVQKRRQPLLDHEKRYIADRIKGLDLKLFSGRSVSDVLTSLVNLLHGELIRLPKAQREQPIDVHEMLVQEMGKDAESYINDRKVEDADTIDSLLRSPRTLQTIFNPDALRRTTYLVLDRRYQASASDNVTSFTWNIANASKTYDPLTTAATTANLRDVVSMKMLPFRFPNTTNALTGTRRLSVELVEFNNIAYIATADNHRFHFIFEIASTGSGTPYVAGDIGNNLAEFTFHDPIIEVNTLTLRFGNPNKVVSLDSDRLNAVASAFGAQTVLTFTTPHRTAIGDYVYISGFTTSSVVSDKALIDVVNSVNGWPATAVSTNTITIDVDLTTLVGVIDVTPIPVYLGGKQFIINLELTYLV